MKLIRRLLRYLLILAFIVLLFAAYYYRALIFSEYINTKVDNAITSVLVMANIVPEQAAPATMEAEDVPDCVPVTKTTQANDIDVVKVEVEVTQFEPARADTEEQTIEVSSGPATEQLPTDGDQTADTDVEQLTEEDPAEVQIEDQSTIEAATENNAGEEGEEVAQKSHFELMNQARHVYQCGDINNSIGLYRELGELYPEDPNVYGELGNVFYSKGEWKQASLAYYEAALRLHKRNQQEQIHYLYRVIQGLDPETAEKLRGQLGS